MIKMCEQKADILPSIEEIRQKPDHVCPVRWAYDVATTARLASCGQDTMCRDGLAQVRLLCEAVCTNNAQPSDLELLRSCCEVIKLAGGCEMCVRCVELVLESMNLYADEWNDHVGARKRCKSLVCNAFCNVYIDPALCKGCGKCIAAAPAGAIEGGEGLISVVRKDAALKTDEFFTVCPNGAIKKYSGSVKPPMPMAPVPVGSFGAAAGGRRRRG